MSKITVHTIIKNEEKFIEYAIRSVINHVNQVMIFDTGSTDRTVEIVVSLQKEFGDKIIFEEKGVCDKTRHTLLRQEMLEKTTTDWFMILDGDEVWTEEGMLEVLDVIENKPQIDCLVAPFHLCVGDLLHEHKKQGSINILGTIGFLYPRVMRNKDIEWRGDYNEDSLFNHNGELFFKESNTYFMKNKYWHMTHLERSNVGTDYSSGGKRNEKVMPTYFYLGREIGDKLPVVFDEGLLKKTSLSFVESVKNFIRLLFIKSWGARRQFSKYFVTGISALVLDILSLYVLKEHFGVSPVVAVIINQGILLNYVFLVNKYWSFGALGMGKRQMVRFYILSGCNYVFSIAWMYLINDGLGVNYLVTRIVNIGMAVSWNFLLYKYWVYKK